MEKKFTVVLLVLAVLLLSSCDSKEEIGSADGEREKVELIVSAAASLSDVLEEIQRAFHKQYPHIFITYNFGGSGKLASQIQNGAPADIFLSASEVDMDNLEKGGFIDPSSRFPFVKNGLALIAPKDSPLNLSNLGELSREEIEHFIIGDPDSVPAGRYGKQALEAVGVWESLDGNFVYVSDVRQVVTQIEAGNGDIGIVFLTDAQTVSNSKIVLQIDGSLHDEIIYPGAIVSTSSNKKAAQQFLDFLKGNEAIQMFNEYGFMTN